MENGYGALGQHAPKPVEQEQGPDWLQFAMEQDMVECHAVVMGPILQVVKVQIDLGSNVGLGLLRAIELLYKLAKNGCDSDLCTNNCGVLIRNIFISFR